MPDGEAKARTRQEGLEVLPVVFVYHSGSFSETCHHEDTSRGQKVIRLVKCLRRRSLGQVASKRVGCPRVKAEAFPRRAVVCVGGRDQSFPREMQTCRLYCPDVQFPVRSSVSGKREKSTGSELLVCPEVDGSRGPAAVAGVGEGICPASFYLQKIWLVLQ